MYKNEINEISFFFCFFSLFWFGFVFIFLFKKKGTDNNFEYKMSTCFTQALM